MSERDKPSAQKATDTPSRTRELLASNLFRVGIVLLAAAIIFSAWAFAEYGREDAPSEDSGITLTLDDEYERARQLAESGDTDAAIEILERVLAEDPNHARAAALLSQLQNGDAASPTPAGGATDPQQPNDTPEPPADEPEPRDDTAYLVAIGDLDVLLPQVISGWQRGTTEKTEADATVSFSASLPGPASRALYAVHDRGSADGALKFIEDTSKVVYRSDGASVRVGAVDGYFGTDGNRLATIAFARGRFAFEVVVTVSEGAPASARDVTMVLAREFEATR